jgi:hypothetical protein
LHRSTSLKLKHFGYLVPLVLLLSSSRFAKAGQEESQNLDVSVTVSPSCAVSTERGAAGAQLDAACPSHIKQSLVREFVIDPTRPSAPGAAVTEQLVLVINF